MAIVKERERKKGHVQLSFYHQMRRVCVLSVQRGTWGVGGQESQTKMVDWWRVLVMAQDLN